MVYVNIQQMSIHIDYLVLVFLKVSLTIMVFSNYSLLFLLLRYSIYHAHITFGTHCCNNQ